MNENHSKTGFKSLPRKAPRDLRREQLIEATIVTVARRGLAQTTLSEVARTAGVSHGLVNFHFQTKDRLMADTLSYLSEQHRRHWEAALDAAGPSPAQRLRALILAEFSENAPEVLTAWCAFWGEAQNRPLYLEQCGANDRAYNQAFEETCGALAREGGYQMDARHAARVLRLTIEGVWLELMFSAQPYPLEEAQQTAFFCAAKLFPRHFGVDGLISR